MKKPNLEDMLHKWRHEFYWEHGKGRKKKSVLFYGYGHGKTDVKRLNDLFKQGEDYDRTSRRIF